MKHFIQYFFTYALLITVSTACGPWDSYPVIQDIKKLIASGDAQTACQELAKNYVHFPFLGIQDSDALKAKCETYFLDVDGYETFSEGVTNKKIYPEAWYAITNSLSFNKQKILSAAQQRRNGLKKSLGIQS